MSSHAFSSLILRDLIKEIEQLLEGIVLEDEEWAEAMTLIHHRALEEQPLVYLTQEDYLRARLYLDMYKTYGLDIPNRATQNIRDKHAADIREFLRTKHNDKSTSTEHDSPEDTQCSLPSNDGAPTCFKEWFAVNQVWRLTLAMTEVPFQDAAFGTPTCPLRRLPEPWEDKLNECLQITQASAVVSIPIGYGLPVTRRDLNSILPTSEVDSDLSGMLKPAILDRWFGILVSFCDRLNLNRVIFIQPDSLELADSTPQEIAENAALADPELDMVLFPTIIKEADHCILAVAMPKKEYIAVYDSLGFESTTVLQKTRSWIKERLIEPEKGIWEVVWFECPQQGEEDACGVFMFINALLVSLDKDPEGSFAKEHTLFLRRFIAAVICMGKLPGSL